MASEFTAFPVSINFFSPELKKHQKGRKTFKDQFCKHFFIFVFTREDKHTNAIPGSLPSLSDCILAFIVSSLGVLLQRVEAIMNGDNLSFTLLSIVYS